MDNKEKGGWRKKRKSRNCWNVGAQAGGSLRSNHFVWNWHSGVASGNSLYHSLRGFRVSDNPKGLSATELDLQG